jgi:hypothetical protein
MIIAISRVGGDENILCYSNYKLRNINIMWTMQVDKLIKSDWYCVP